MKKENKTKEKDVVTTTKPHCILCDDSWCEKCYEEKTKMETKKNDNPITLADLS
tara:strand:+ start:85 stop:246 length:162 start_codon:yes stop_codon:yes gene_type:complete